MAFAAPVSIAPAGTGGVLTGQGGLGGVEGVFAALLGSGSAGIVTGQGGVLVGGGEGGMAEARQPEGVPGLIETLLPLQGAVQVTVQGDSQTVAAFVQQVQGLFQGIVASGALTAGGDEGTRQLAAALQKMGLSPEEAAGMAEQVDTMLKVVAQQQGRDLSDDEKASLTALMLAALVPNPAGQAFDIQIAAKGTQAATVSVVQAGKAFEKGKAPSPADVARQMAGMGGVAARPVEAGGKEASQVGEAKPKAADAKGSFRIEVTHNGEAQATVRVALPDAGEAAPLAAAAQARADLPPPVAAAATVAAQAAPVVTTGAAKPVEDGARLDAVRGETLYKLQADKDGVETLQAVRPVEDGAAAAAVANGQPQPAAHAGPAPHPDAPAGMAFAERLALARHSDVAQQVHVQMKPLLAEGGGHVRMTLNPPELGRISIDLQVSDGKVQGAIAATDPAVVEQLARELHNLRHGLADAGLKLGNQGINLMLNDANQFAQGQGQHGHGRRGRGGGRTPVEGVAGVEAVTEAAAWIAPERVLDVKI